MATVAARKIKMLVAKRDSHYSILQKMLDFTKTLNDPSIARQFKTLYQSIDITRKELLRIVDEIEAEKLEADANYEPNFAIIPTINEICCHIHEAASKLNTTVKKEPSNGSVSLAERKAPMLPTIEIPEFTGEFWEWPSFYAVFKSLIHDNTALSDVDRIHYLMGRLKGKAISICSGLPPVQENYQLIWNKLIEKYENKRALATSYLDQILEFKPLTGESAKSLNLFLEKFDSAVQVLKKFDIPDLADFIILYLALSRLDSETVKSFEMFKRDSKDIPKYDDLVNFVQGQAKILSINKKLVKPEQRINLSDTSKSRSIKSCSVNTCTSTSKTNLCSFCGNEWHYLAKCPKFLKLTSSKRYELVRDKNWCFNCLFSNHGVRFCRSNKSCAECGKKHHTLLHGGRGDETSRSLTDSGKQGNSSYPAVESSETVSISREAAVNNVCSDSIYSVLQGSTVLLSTVVVNVLNSRYENNTARFLLDSGSQVNLITVRCCKRLGLKVTPFFSSVLGLGQVAQKVRGSAVVDISSRYDSSEQFSFKTLLVDRISENLPKMQVDVSQMPHLLKFPLADNDFYMPGEVDGIIGAELFPLIFKSADHIGSHGTPNAFQTSLGYIIMGKAPVISSDINLQNCFTLSEEIPVERLLNNFWEIEDVPKSTRSTTEEVACERIYDSTWSRDESGRFVVSLPFKYPPQMLGNSEITAKSRLLSLERRLDKSSQLRVEYNKVMQDFLEQGHMRKLCSNIIDELCYYIPHHAVFKPESTSTPVRVVLDASAASDSGFSLNDVLYTGPKLQADIFTLIINFRLFKIAVTADIRQMYRQINLVENHHKFQRLLWRFSADQDIEIYEVTTIAFGVKSSPYLALRTVKQLIKEEKAGFPIAAEYVERDLYMDDLVSSTNTVEEGMRLYRETSELFTRGKFELTKWSTNNDQVLNIIPVSKRFTQPVQFKNQTKILGMQWNPETDVISFHLDVPDSKGTKRGILSSVARCFDPIGVIAPFIMYLKLLVKELWHLKLGWDDDPPEEVKNLWKVVLEEWPLLRKFHIARHTGASASGITLLAFADASKEGYGAVVYLRTYVANQTVSVKLVCAKSKVAPFKFVSIPRLELCAALLLSKLVQHVVKVYGERVAIDKIWAFSDSTIVIHWLHTDTAIKDVFVCNRISQIWENLPNAQWCHVEGENNPADCLSRGLTPSELVNHHLWISGPRWAVDDEQNWPVSPAVDNRSLSYDSSVFVASKEVDSDESHPLLNLIARRSSWMTILHVTVWVLRFLKLLPKAELIQATDLEHAEMVLIRLVQMKHFSKEFENLKANRLCSSKFRKLHLFLKDGLLRVGGRLGHSQLDYDQRYPLLLPKKDVLVERLVEYFHCKHFHTGPYLLEALLRQKYWILAGRSVIRNRVHACNRCFRCRPTSCTPLMAHLPTPRVTQAKAFLNTGVDYFGPVNLTEYRKRGAAIHKAYVCLFICMSIKAIHLELVSSLSTDHFLQAFKRFLSRRGPCRTLYSDRGTNFVGAKRVLADLKGVLTTKGFNDKINTELSNQGVDWKFISPSAPHMGGLWESNVKSVKTHIYRVIGDQLLTYEELQTLLVQIEALLNSRPLCQLSSDASAPAALTPAHFLTLSPLNNLPAVDLSQVKMNRLDRFQLIDRMVQDFWKRWHAEYLTTLQTRAKWHSVTPNVTVGLVVILKNENTPPLSWPLAVVTEVHPGDDGHVRVVTVKTTKGCIFTRPVVKLCPLPTQ